MTIFKKTTIAAALLTSHAAWGATTLLKCSESNIEITWEDEVSETISINFKTGNEVYQFSFDQTHSFQINTAYWGYSLKNDDQFMEILHSAGDWGITIKQQGKVWLKFPESLKCTYNEQAWYKVLSKT